MSKFFKRIAKDSIKFTADFVATEISATMSAGEVYVRLQIQRGDQKPSILAPVLIRN